MSRLITLLQRGFAVLGGVALVVMLFVAVLDIVLRLFGSPLPGSFEVIGWLSAVAMGSALAYTQAHKGHVAIRIAVDLLPERARLAVEALVWLLATLLIAVTAYHLFVYAADLHEYGSRSETLRAPVYPWVYALAGGLAVFALVLARDFILSLAALVRRREPGPSSGEAAAAATEGGRS